MNHDDESEAHGGSGLQPAPPSIEQDSIARWLDMQQQEMALRSQELDAQREQLELQKLELKHAQEWSMRSLELQAVDRKEERASDATMSTRLLVFGTCVVAGLLGLAAFAISQGQGQLLKDLILAVGSAAGGGGLVAVFGRNDTNNQNQNPPKDPPP